MTETEGFVTLTYPDGTWESWPSRDEAVAEANQLGALYGLTVTLHGPFTRGEIIRAVAANRPPYRTS